MIYVPAFRHDEGVLVERIGNGKEMLAVGEEIRPRRRSVSDLAKASLA